MDNLTYRYNSGNQLKTVTDAGTTEGFKQGSGDYLYDANGNMIVDPNRGLSDIKYNNLNLPYSITKGSDKIGYVYDVAGRKLANKLSGKTKYYFGNFVYTDDKLEYMICSDGLLNINRSTTDYEFHLKDHLGNTRVAVNETNDITQENNYYPFGLTFAQSGSSTNKYLYNGKEKQDETDWLDYGARFYDAYIGRFFNQDRFAEKYVEMSPYQYGGNNPIKFIDVNGDSLWINYEGNRILYKKGKLLNKDGSDYLGAGVKRDRKGNVKLKGFLKSVVDDLRTIGSKKDGARMLSDIQDSYFSVDIVKNNKTKFSGYTSDAKILPFGEANTGSSSTIFFNRYGETSGPDSEGNTYVDSFITLSHELGHAWDASEGLLDLRPYSRAANGDIITCSELFATHYENRIRSEHKKPLRKYYDYDFTKNTGNLRLINGTKSLFYNWDYKTGMTL